MDGENPDANWTVRLGITKVVAKKLEVCRNMQIKELRSR